jgi:uncharacterized repeat protein (TIGR03803 family)
MNWEKSIKGLCRNATAICLAAAALAAASSADATTYKRLYSFQGGDGNGPYVGALIANNGRLYGSTWAGGTAGLGTVYSIKTDGTGEQVLHSLQGKPNDGGGGGAGLLQIRKKLYGTTYQGGDGPCGDRGAGGGCGTVYSLGLDGSKEKILYSFQNMQDGYDGGNGQLIYDKSASKLYGVVDAGGQFGLGTVFSIDPDGSNLTVVYALGNGSDPGTPQAALTRIKDKLYSTGSEGGACGQGAVFWTKEDGTSHKVLHSFCGGSDGISPTGGLIEVNGMLYGTTQFGGGSANCANGCGTVFSINPKNGDEEVIYAFQGHPDGSLPTYTGVTYNEVDGRLYGVTSNGGSFTCPGGACGTVFSMNLDGSDEQVVYSFQGQAHSDGMRPEQDLLLLNGTFYGTTYLGGNGACTNGCGTVFSITP